MASSGRVPGMPFHRDGDVSPKGSLPAGCWQQWSCVEVSDVARRTKPHTAVPESDLTDGLPHPAPACSGSRVPSSAFSLKARIFRIFHGDLLFNCYYFSLLFSWSAGPLLDVHKGAAFQGREALLSPAYKDYHLFDAASKVSPPKENLIKSATVSIIIVVIVLHFISPCPTSPDYQISVRIIHHTPTLTMSQKKEAYERISPTFGTLLRWHPFFFWIFGGNGIP